jgi:hypothetical protein
MKRDMPIGNCFAQLRKKAIVFAQVVVRLIGMSPKRAGNHTERSIEEFKRLSGSGHSDGWRFDRDEIHQRR